MIVSWLSLSGYPTAGLVMKVIIQILDLKVGVEPVKVMVLHGNDLSAVISLL